MVKNKKTIGVWDGENWGPLISRGLFLFISGKQNLFPKLWHVLVQNFFNDYIGCS